jgi:hypothetical protein
MAMNDKVMTNVMFVAAISLSCIAAWYSIAGLTAIFAAAVVPIIIMGGILEVSKLVVASWLYRNWEEVPNTFKTYFTAAVVILMMITSMGIFGFLSKAHLDQAVPAGDITSQVTIYDDKIKTERDNVAAARKALTQMDAQIDQKLSRSTDEKGADKAIQIRRSQSSERKKLQNEISESQKTIVKLQTERAPIASQARKIEAEVGPIKYIAALIYGDTLDANVLEKAVRWVIIMIVLVFDPLAVLMLVAVNWSLKKRQLEVEPEELPEDISQWINYPINLDPVKKPFPHKILRQSKPKKRKWLESELDPAPLPEPADPIEDTHYDPNEYISPAKTIEEEVDELQHKPLNSLDRLNKKYGDLNS